ncbi:DUF4349 domain-containing protein [Lentzea sp. NPDC051213]|uniref:DUF4349 domain-containing protein n=1 Tax=Lentzea sp. NPDC051213 TaxID=3364126 RepID=UPI0037962FB0
MGRPVLWVGVALLALVSAGCSSAKDSGTSAGYNAAAPEAATQKVAPQQGNPQEKAPAPAAVQPVQEQERQLVRTATVDLRSDDVRKAVSQVKDRAQGAGGFAGQENTTSTYGSVTVRVPSNQLDTVVDGLEQVGEVTRREMRSEDVTDQLVDVEARIATQKASVERLRVLFERAGSTTEIAQIEGELTKRQSELESMQRRSESLKGKVAMATLTVQVSTTPLAPPQEKKAGFGGAFAAGWDALGTAFRWITVGVGGLLPFLLVLGVPAAVVIYLLRRRRVTRTNEAA